MTDRTDSTEFEISSLTCYWKEREFKETQKFWLEVCHKHSAGQKQRGGHSSVSKIVL